jgi:asparagine synthase (glutamine-hydrolysing)
MAASVGLFELDGRPVSPADLCRLAAAVNRPAAIAPSVWVSGPFGICPKPFITPSGAAIALDGRLDDAGAIADRRAANMGARRESDAGHLADVYVQNRGGFAAELTGDFALALFDPVREVLLLARDVMGGHCLYYTRTRNTLLFASHITALLAHPAVTAAPDDDALADFVLDRWLDGERTCFREIHSVAPGQVVTVTRDGISTQQVWSFDPSRAIRYRDPDEYAEQFSFLFAQAVRRRMRGAGKAGVMVSGGIDSSAVLCQAAVLSEREPGMPAVCGISMVFPEASEADEQRFLDDITGRYRTEIERVPVSELRLFEHARTVVAAIELPCLAWDAQREVLRRANRSGCSVLMDGYYGDQVLFPRRYLVDLARRGQWRRVRRHLRAFRAWMTDVEPGFFERDFREALLRAFLRPSIFASVKRLAATRRARRYPAWYTKRFIGRVLERQMSRFEPRIHFASCQAEECYRHATAGHYLFQTRRQNGLAAMHGVEMAQPFRDRDLIAFLMAVPGEAINPDGVPKGLLRRALSEVLPPPIRDRRWKADFTQFGNRATLREYDLIEALLTKDCLAAQAGYVDGSTIAEAIRRHRRRVAQDDSAEAGWRLNEVVALELWLRHFFGGQQERDRLDAVVAVNEQAVV